MKIKLHRTYLFSNDKINWEEGKLTRKDRHVYPYCANYKRFKYIKENRS